MDNDLLNALWLTIAAGMVFLMQAGFLCLEVGLTRSKNTINVAIKNIMDFVISILLFWAIGYGIAFGFSWNGLFGISDFFAEFEKAKDTSFFIFQAMFCATSVTIISGAVAERMKFPSYLIIATFVSAIVYTLIAHWVWNGINTNSFDGFLIKQGFYDFAGSTVVHSVGGWCALAALIILGPRLGRFSSDGKVNKFTAQNIPFALLGVFILWFGWFGFNGGAVYKFNDDVPMVILNTILASASGSVFSAVIGWRIDKKPHLLHPMLGALAGLVSITASANIVSPVYALLIGGLGGVVSCVISYLLLKLKIDDAVNAIPVHLGGGVWGTLCVGFFGDISKLHIEIDRLQLIFIQIEGIIICGIWAFGITYLFLRIVDYFYPLRVSREAELIGLNISEHDSGTELYDLFNTMDHHFKTQDLSKRVQVDEFSEVGEIAVRYNRVMKRLDDKNKENIEYQKQISHYQKMESLGNLTGGISHEYNNIMGVIMGYSDLLHEDLKDQPKLSNYVGEIKNAIERSTNLTNNLLHFTNMNLTYKNSLNINNFLEDKRGLIEKTLTSRINVIYKLNENLWPVNVNEGALGDALINISINSMHAIEGNGELIFKTENVTIKIIETHVMYLNPGDYVKLSISDTGCGIELNIKDMIFDPFYTTKGNMGTGLGLSQVYGFMNNSDGVIQVDSTVGLGTQIILYFPCQKK